MARSAGSREEGSREPIPRSGPARSPLPTVVIVDDDKTLREALGELIRFAGWKPETFATADAFLSRPPPETPSCLVLDIVLPGLSGLDLQERLAAGGSEIPIIFITGHADVPKTLQAMKGGALEFLVKPFSEEALLRAIERAIERSRRTRRRAAELKVLRERYGCLTRREREIMKWVVAGLLNKEVGAELGRSEITIKAHRGKVMHKMQADSFADLVRMAAALELPLPSKPVRQRDAAGGPTVPPSKRALPARGRPLVH